MRVPQVLFLVPGTVMSSHDGGRRVGWWPGYRGFKYFQASDIQGIWPHFTHRHSGNKGLLLMRTPWALIHLDVSPSSQFQCHRYVKHLSECSSLCTATALFTSLFSTLPHCYFCLFNNYLLSYLLRARHYS